MTMTNVAKVLEALTPEIKGWLGTGIDIFQCEPFEAPSTKPASLLSSSLPKDFRRIESMPAIKYREIYADSLLEMNNQLTVEAGLKGSYGGVSGSVDSKYTLSQGRTEKRHLLQIFFFASNWFYSITKSKEGLKQLLDPDFKNALATGDVDDLFKTYGTHLIVKMMVGGRAEYSCESSNLTSISKEDFSVTAKAKYASAGGSIEGSTAVGSSNSIKTELVSGSINIATTGGLPEHGVKLRDGAWGAWVGSIDARPGFLGFDKDNGLLPIWDLAPTDARKKEINEAYRIKAAKALRTEILSVTSEVTNHPVARVTVPAGYKLVGGGARSNWDATTGRGNLLTASFPETPNTWMAASKDHWGDDSASITAFAIAIHDPDNLWDVKISKSNAGNDELTPMREQPVESGYVMVGGGAQVLWSGKDANGKDKVGNMLFASYPKDPNTWRGHSKWQGKNLQSPAKLVAYAIGLKCKLKDITVNSAIQDATSNESGRPKATASVASDHVMTGGGACILYGEGFPGVLLTESYPKDGKTWEGKGKDHLDPCSTAIVVRSIGVKVT
jgi:MAC/Perforin domain-containing protein